MIAPIDDAVGSPVRRIDVAADPIWNEGEAASTPRSPVTTIRSADSDARRTRIVAARALRVPRGTTGPLITRSIDPRLPGPARPTTVRVDADNCDGRRTVDRHRHDLDDDQQRPHAGAAEPGRHGRPGRPLPRRRHPI